MIFYGILLAVFFSSVECLKGNAQISAGIDFKNSNDFLKYWALCLNLPSAYISAGISGDLDFNNKNENINPWNILGKLPKAGISAGVSGGFNFHKKDEKNNSWNIWGSLPKPGAIISNGVDDLKTIAEKINPWNIWGSSKKPEISAGGSEGLGLKKIAGKINPWNIWGNSEKNGITAGTSGGLDWQKFGGKINPWKIWGKLPNAAKIFELCGEVLATTEKSSESVTENIDFSTVTPTTEEVSTTISGDEDLTTVTPATDNKRASCNNSMHHVFYDVETFQRINATQPSKCDDSWCNEMCLNSLFLVHCGYCAYFVGHEEKDCHCHGVFVNESIPNETEECKKACENNYVYSKEYRSLPSLNITCICGLKHILWNVDTHL